MSKKLFFIILFNLSILHAGYYLSPSQREQSKIDKMPKAEFNDLSNIPQDLSYYANQVKSFSYEDQKRYDNEYNQKYFAPWVKSELIIPPQDFGWETRFVREKPIFRENASQISPYIYEEWISNANMSSFNAIKARAITLKRLNLKSLPTDEEFFRNPNQIGEGFPFDYNQNSAYPPNMPLLISHYSKDEKWAFVQGAYAFGWVRTKDIALVDDNFIQQFQNGNYAITIKDNLRLYNDNHAISLVKLGTIFPYDKDGYFFATKDKNGYATLTKFNPTENGIISHKPLKFTPENITKIASQFKNEPYGWGENYETRDCSALTRDFFAPFGIFLDRNSGQQAKNGCQVSIKSLDKNDKKKKILENAKPFRSMLFVPGHIVLYIGEYNNEPVVMHAYWGIRQNDWTKLITGRTIISTTEPAKELNSTRAGSQLIETLQSIVSF